MKRPQLKVHPSTLIMLAFAGWTLFVVNAMPKGGNVGWPFIFREFGTIQAGSGTSTNGAVWSIPKLCLDALIALALLAAIAFACEWGLRRSGLAGTAAKLPRLQLHLSTCIVLMFVAGGLMWPNILTRDFIEYSKSGREMKSKVQGWPCAFYEDSRSESERSEDGQLLTEFENHPQLWALIKEQTKDGRIIFRGKYSDVEFEFIPLVNGEAPYKLITHEGTLRTTHSGISTNILIALVILTAVAFVCEWIIRRRKPTSERAQP